MYVYGILKPVKVILGRGMRKRENNGGDEPNWNTLYTHIEKSKQNLLYDYYILIKMLKK
jgi:hypothetical protein